MTLALTDRCQTLRESFWPSCRQRPAAFVSSATWQQTKSIFLAPAAFLSDRALTPAGLRQARARRHLECRDVVSELDRHCRTKTGQRFYVVSLVRSWRLCIFLFLGLSFSVVASIEACVLFKVRLQLMALRKKILLLMGPNHVATSVWPPRIATPVCLQLISHGGKI